MASKQFPVAADTFMKGDPQQGPAPQTLNDIANAFVAARRACRALPAYPGVLPSTLDHAYLCQDAAINLWHDRIGGWKVGRIPPELESDLGCDRLAGPIFQSTIRTSTSGEGLLMPVFDGGFAAVEGEFVAAIGSDAPKEKRHWSLAEAAEMIGALHIGLEVASSPLAIINDIGPLAVVSDFGNNAGLIIGPVVDGWRDRPLSDLCCEAFVEGRSVGRGGAAQLSGGYLRSVQFMLELAAQRDRPLTAGTLIATGQTTGIHEIRAGQKALLDFGADGQLRCHFTSADAN